MISVLHRIEDLQVACFAVIFGLMAWQLRKNRTIQYAWLSYLLGSVVSVIDVTLKQPFSAFTLNCIFTIISIRYAVLAASMTAFTRRSRWLMVMAFGVAAGSVVVLFLPQAGVTQHLISGLYYLVLAIQLSLLCVIVLLSEEKATRMPRRLIGVLFFLSVACRSTQMWAAWAHASPRALWLRQGLFLNSTVIGCVLPFTIVWMMNARVQKDLLQQSLMDPLTDLLNRRGLLDAAQRELTRYARARQNFAVAVADIDHFKSLNDTHGHACGDEVLRQTAMLFRDVLRQSDIVTRSGGEEFVILLPMTPEEETFTVLERVRTTLQNRSISVGNGLEVKTTVSIGITNTRDRVNLTWNVLQNEADLALYAAKRTGRNRSLNFNQAMKDEQL